MHFRECIADVKRQDKPPSEAKRRKSGSKAVLLDGGMKGTKRA
jgi:hypothetical protein